MPEAPLLPTSPLQSQIAQMALELARELERQAAQAPRGTILDACESLLLDRGRQFLRDSLAARTFGDRVVIVKESLRFVSRLAG